MSALKGIRESKQLRSQPFKPNSSHVYTHTGSHWPQVRTPSSAGDASCAVWIYYKKKIERVATGHRFTHKNLNTMWPDRDFWLTAKLFFFFLMVHVAASVCLTCPLMVCLHSTRSEVLCGFWLQLKCVIYSWQTEEKLERGQPGQSCYVWMLPRVCCSHNAAPQQKWATSMAMMDINVY